MKLSLGKATWKALGVLAGSVAGSIFLAVLSWGLVVQPWQLTRDARTWSATTCKIDTLEVIQRRDSDGDVQEDLYLRYHYAVGDRTFSGRRYDFGPYDDETIDRAIAMLEPGDRVPCYYDAAAPERSVIERRWSPTFAPFVVAGFLAMLVGIPFAVIRWRRVVRPRRDGRLVSSRRLNLASEVASIAAALVVLVPGTVLAADAWPPFVVAGVGVALFGAMCWLLYRAAILSIRATITLTPRGPRLGETVEATWNVKAPFGLGRRGALTLVGRESIAATERRENAVVTDVYELELGAIDDAEGARTLTLPAAAMPSFEGETHQMLWQVVMKTRLRSSVEFDVHLDPPAPPSEKAQLPDVPTAAAGEIVLDTARDQVCPGEPIIGHLVWNRAAAPRTMALRLRWSATGARRSSGGVMIEDEASHLPRPVVAARGEGPYRGIGSDDAAVPLAAEDARRFSIVAPSRPLSYVGKSFRVEWTLEVVLDGKPIIARPIIIGPDRAAVTTGTGDRPRPAAWWKQLAGRG